MTVALFTFRPKWLERRLDKIPGEFRAPAAFTIATFAISYFPLRSFGLGSFNNVQAGSENICNYGAKSCRDRVANGRSKPVWHQGVKRPGRSEGPCWRWAVVRPDSGPSTESWVAIGNTPLIRLNKLSEETGCTILGKAELGSFDAAFGR